MMAQKKITEHLTLGVDLGGTKVNVALVDASGRLLYACHSLIHASKEPNRVIADITCRSRRVPQQNWS